MMILGHHLQHHTLVLFVSQLHFVICRFEPSGHFCDTVVVEEELGNDALWCRFTVLHQCEMPSLVAEERLLASFVEEKQGGGEKRRSQQLTTIRTSSRRCPSFLISEKGNNNSRYFALWSKINTSTKHLSLLQSMTLAHIIDKEECS
jgi:hypothetical protein